MEPLKIPDDKKSKTVRDLKIKEIAWTDLEAMFINEEDKCFIDLTYFVKSKKTKGYSLKIQRIKGGFKVFIYQTRKKWSYYVDDERDVKDSRPVIEFDTFIINPKLTKKNLEDQILMLIEEKNKAVMEFKYEDAAELRDKIMEIEKYIFENFHEKITISGST